MQLTDQEESRLAMLASLRREVLSASKESEWSFDGETFLGTDDFLICLAFEEGEILRIASERVGSC